MPVRQHYNVTLAILTTAGTAFALQQTLVFPALPTFARELDTTTAWATWVLTIFLVSASVLTPVLGRLGDQYGKERMLVVSLSIFVLGAPPVAFAIWLVHRYIPESPVRAKAGVDVPGALLLSAALISFLLALTEGESWGWTSAPVLGLLVLSVALLVAWVEVERRVPEPMVDMRMMAYRPVLLTNVTTLIAGFAMFGTFVLVPLLVQTDPRWGYGFGASATESGLYLLPSSLMMLVAGPLGGVLGQRYGSALPLAAGMLTVSGGALVLAAWHDEPWQIVAAMVLVGVGVALG